MRVLAIDPGTIKMGYGFLVNEPATEVVDYGVVSLSRYTDIGGAPLPVVHPRPQHD